MKLEWGNDGSDIQIDGFELNWFLPWAEYPANDSYFTEFIKDPIGNIEFCTKTEINGILDKLWVQSTKQYIQTFLICMKYLIDFEGRLLGSFLDRATPRIKILLSLLYLAYNPRTSQIVHSKLVEIVTNCKPKEASAILWYMIQIWFIWNEDILEDPIIDSFMTKARIWETMLYLVGGNKN